MKYYGNRSLASMLRRMLDITLLIGAAATVLIFYNTLFSKQDNMTKSSKILVIALLVVGIICVFLIVFDLRKVIVTLVDANPFVMSNVKSLKRVSTECFIISGCYLVNFIFGSNFEEFKLLYIDAKGVHTDMEFLIFLFAGCFILILSKVFHQAVLFKEENDLLI